MNMLKHNLEPASRVQCHLCQSIFYTVLRICRLHMLFNVERTANKPVKSYKGVSGALRLTTRFKTRPTCLSRQRIEVVYRIYSHFVVERCTIYWPKRIRHLASESFTLVLFFYIAEDTYIWQNADKTIYRSEQHDSFAANRTVLTGVFFIGKVSFYFLLY